MHFCGAALKSRVLADDPSALGHGPVPNENGGGGDVVWVVELPFGAALDAAVTELLSSLPPRDRNRIAPTIKITAIPTLRTVRSRCRRRWWACAAATRAWRPSR